jgi:hypothetical protein
VLDGEDCSAAKLKINQKRSNATHSRSSEGVSSRIDPADHKMDPL